MATPIEELIALLGYDIQGEENLRRFNQSLDALEQKAAAIGAALVSMAALAGAAAIGGMATLGSSVIQTSAKFETYAATLETIEGSAEKAQKALDWIKDFAKTTPYEVDELTAAFVKLRSYGMDPMGGMMNVLGDTAAGMGKSIDQVVEAMADASTFQFERLRELGIVASQKGDQVTFSWTENGKSMSKVIKKTSDDVTKFLNDVWGKKFGGAMIRQSKTWNGMVSNLGDTWTAFQLKIGEAGFFDTAKNKLADFMEQLNKWQDDGTIDNIADLLGTTLTKGLDVLGATLDRVGRHVSFFMQNWDKLVPWIKGIGAVLLAVGATTFPVLTIFAGIALAVDDLLTYMEGGESVIGNFVEWLRSVIPASKETQDAILKLGGAIAGGLLLAFAVAPRRMLGVVTGGLSAVLGAIGGTIMGWLAPLGSMISGLFSSLGSLLLRGLMAALGVVSGPVGWALMAVAAAGLIYAFWDSIVAGWDWVTAQGAALFSTISEWLGVTDWSASISNLFGSLLTSLSSAWNSLSGTVKGLFATASEWVSNIDWADAGYKTGRFLMDAIANGIIGSIYYVVQAFSAVKSAIFDTDWQAVGKSIADSISTGWSNFVSSFSNMMKQGLTDAQSFDWAGLGKTIVDGLMSWAATFPTLWLNVIVGMSDSIRDAVKKWFDVDLYDIGAKILNSLWRGMQAVGGQIKEYVKGLFTFDLPFGLGSNGPGTPANSNLPLNAEQNLQRVDGASGKAGVVQDNSTRTVTTNVNAPVQVNVQQASQAPAAVGNAISGATKSALQPARMNGGGGF